MDEECKGCGIEMDTQKSLEKHIAKMQYHSIMARKHKKLARFQYTILIRILGHENTVKKYLKEIGIKNTLFNKGVDKNEKCI